jgi:hypothetical protein
MSLNGNSLCRWGAGTEDAFSDAEILHMAKRSSTTGNTKKTTATRSSAPTPSAESASVMERQVLAFAEQLGYVAGSIQSKAGGVVDRGVGAVRK